jgi:hypothetical protein
MRNACLQYNFKPYAEHCLLTVLHESTVERQTCVCCCCCCCCSHLNFIPQLSKVAKAWASLPSCEQQAATNTRLARIRQKQCVKREVAAAGAPAPTAASAGNTSSTAAAGAGVSSLAALRAATAAAGGDVSDDDDSDVEVVCERDPGSVLADRRAAAARAGLCIDLTAEADPAEVAAAGAQHLGQSLQQDLCSGCLQEGMPYTHV